VAKLIARQLVTLCSTHSENIVRTGLSNYSDVFLGQHLRCAFISCSGARLSMTDAINASMPGTMARLIFDLRASS